MSLVFAVYMRVRKRVLFLVEIFQLDVVWVQISRAALLILGIIYFRHFKYMSLLKYLSNITGWNSRLADARVALI